MKKLRLRARLSLSYAIMALFLIAIISFALNVSFRSQFQNYIISEQNRRNQELVASIERQYDTTLGKWDKNTLENIGINALEQGLILRVKDAQGTVQWDATVHNNGLCMQMISHMAQNMQKSYSNFEGGYQQKSFPLTLQFQTIGTAEIGYYGPFYFSDNDVQLLNSVNHILAGVGIVSLFMALLLGGFMARRISRPISSAVRTTAEIARGNFEQYIQPPAGPPEMRQLAESVNFLAESLQKQQLLRKRMAADVAHELRTPLANLQSTLEAMIDGIWQADTPHLKSCHEEILRINRLVGDLEALERFEEKSTELTCSTFDVSELLTRVVQSFEPEFIKKEVTVSLEQDEVILCADRDKIQQATVNLLSNALKYTPSGGSVTVTCHKVGQQAVLTVADTGIGIPQADIPYIFERFYRSDRSRARKTGGLGLGLTITRAIVEAHQGSITVKSTEQEGTVFTVSFPLFQENESR